MAHPNAPPGGAGHPPIPNLLPNPIQNILDTALGYSAPDYQPMYPAVPPTAFRLPAEVSGNTTHREYTLESVRDILPWDVSLATMARFVHVLKNARYDPVQLQHEVLQAPDPPLGATRVAAETCLVRPLFADTVSGQYRLEQALAHRLDSCFFPDLARIMHYIDLYHTTHPGWYMENSTPIMPEVGGQMRTAGNHLPDRGAKRDLNESCLEATARLMGDIKPSFKFHSSWRPAQNVAFLDPTPKVPVTEFRKVLAQVKYYMENLACDPTTGLSARYGYVITDEEVVLLQRLDETEGPGYRSSLRVSQGFPLRRAPGQPPLREADGQINGMLALLLVHMMASDEAAYLA